MGEKKRPMCKKHRKQPLVKKQMCKIGEDRYFCPKCLEEDKEKNES